MTNLIDDWIETFQPERDKFDLYTKLIQEETAEFDESPEDLFEACDLIWVAVGKALQKFTTDELHQGMLKLYKANMSKLGTKEEVTTWLLQTGQHLHCHVEKRGNKFVAVRNDDGKILKGPNHVKAENI